VTFSDDKSPLKSGRRQSGGDQSESELTSGISTPLKRHLERSAGDIADASRAKKPYVEEKVPASVEPKSKKDVPEILFQVIIM
jgi:hypothetical protein